MFALSESDNGPKPKTLRDPDSEFNYKHSGYRNQHMFKIFETQKISDKFETS